MKLRDYQEDAVIKYYRNIDGTSNDVNSILFVMATGTGKTVVFCEVAHRWHKPDGRVMIIAHRKELIDQAAEKFFEYTGEIASIEMGDRKDLNRGNKVLVSSIQTMNSKERCNVCLGDGVVMDYDSGGMMDCVDCTSGSRHRMCGFDPMDFGLLIYDEAHHAVSNSGRRLIEYMRKNPNLKELYVTATPHRKDEIGMRSIIDMCVINMGIKESVEKGWLVPIKQKYIMVDGLDYSEIKTVAKDLNQGQLAEAMGGKVLDESEIEAIKEQEEFLHKIVDPIIKECGIRSCIVFAVNLEQSKRMTEIFNRHEDGCAEFIHGKTHKDIRDKLTQDFRDGRYQYLVNVGIATEGFDAPICEVIAMARATLSQSLYIQMIGRGTRPETGCLEGIDDPEERRTAISESGKTHMTVLDFVGNTGRHKLVTTADVLAGDLPESVVAAAVKEMKESDSEEDIQEMLNQKSMEALLRQQEQQRKDDLEAEARKNIIASAEYRTETIDAFGHKVLPDVVEKKRKKGNLSKKQKDYLIRLGVSGETASGYSKGQAGKVIQSIKDKKGGEYVLSFGKYSGTGKKLKDAPKKLISWVKSSKMSDGWLKTELMKHINIMESQRELQKN